MMLAAQTPAAPLILVSSAAQLKADLAFRARSSGWLSSATSLGGQGGARPGRQEIQQERDARVRRVRIYPGDVTVRIGERINFAAVAFDDDATPVSGVGFVWAAHDSVRGRRERVSRSGEFVPGAAGRYVITAEGAGRRAQVTVTVAEMPGWRGRGAARRPGRAVSSRDLPRAVAALRGKPSGRRGDSRRGSARFVKSSLAEPPPAAAPARVRAQLDENYQWNENNYTEADDPGNRRGDPPGVAADSGAGSGNFQFAAPVIGLPGRGLDLSLALAYNSRVWSKVNGEMAFDMDKDWPAPGWSLGFGKITGLGPNGALMTDGDGTRHGFAGTVTTDYYGNRSFTGHTADGTFVDYDAVSYADGNMNWARAKLPNGTVIDYGAFNQKVAYPISITDANGNFVVVTYRNNQGPAIETVTDTLGRVVNFHYDSNNLLTAVTGPGQNGGTRTLVRLHYKQHALDYSYSLTARVPAATVPVVDAIYYPATGTGYWFGDPLSYSSYGMIASLREQRGMTFSASPLTEQGTVTAGVTTRQADYDYPLTAAAGTFDDAPTYDKMTETWEGADAGPAETHYAVYQNSSPRRVEITFPGGVKSVQYSHNAPGSHLDGLVYHDELKAPDDTTLSSSTVEWGQGAYSSPRPVSTEAVDHEIGKKTAATFDYGPVYNQVIAVHDYDYADIGATPAARLRVTRTDYENDSHYTSRHIFNLVKKVSVYAGDDATRVSQIEYQYDGAPLQNAPGVTMHSQHYNPHAPVTEVCGYEDNTDDRDYQFPGCENIENPFFHHTCDGIVGQVYVCRMVTAYWQTTDYRGNVTQIKTYSDAAGPTGEIVETRRYDITGNLVTASSACCEQTSLGYTPATQYAYPTSQTRGSASDAALQVTTGATYDFNTGLVLTSTDADGRTAVSTYYDATLRPEKVISPTGAYAFYEYDEAAMKVTETLYTGAPPADNKIAGRSVRHLNGRGQVRREEALGEGGVWDAVETRYDVLGRVWKQTQPFRSTVPAAQWRWAENFYDVLGRVRKSVAPDGSETETFYNEAGRPGSASGAPGHTTRAVDTWGRERWGRTDAQGRLVEVVEPNPNGNGAVSGAGSLLTTYSYDVLGNLTEVEQGAQTRSFRYDSLGRLTRQKLAEASATLDAAGTHVGVGGAGAGWSDVFAYDSRSNLLTRTDARGVRTKFSYELSPNTPDPLNRLHSVSYDKTGVPAALQPSIADAATVNYTYGVNSNGALLADKTQLGKVKAVGVSEEVYTFDTSGRVIRKSVTLDGRASHPFETDYDYDELERVKTVTYPRQYPATTRKIVSNTFDVASRLSGLKVDGVDYASQIVYNAASQTTSLKVGAAGANQITENYDYDPATGLLANQTVVRGAGASALTLLNLSYEYLREGTTGGRTGQLTKLTDHRNPQRGRRYSYDALGRLVQARGGDAEAAALWTQAYVYDRYGNRQSVTATGQTAKLEKPGEPKVSDPTRQLAYSVTPLLPEHLRGGGDRRAVSDSPSVSPLSGYAPGGASAALVLAAPTNLQVTSASGSDVSLSWTAGSGADAHYEVERSQSLAGPYVTVSNSPSTTFNDLSVSGGAAHLYRVRAVDAAGNRSQPSNIALGGAFSFADDPIITSADDPSGLTVTKVKALHVTQLRDAVNAVRACAGLPPAVWGPELAQTGAQIRASHVQELRERLNEALSALQIATPPFTDPTLSAGANGTPVRRVHIAQLRQRATRGQSASAGGASPAPVPADGLASLSFDEATNRINTAGWEYDSAGSQTRMQVAGGAWRRAEYDAAGRMVRVKTDAGTVTASYTYGDSNQRLVADEGGLRTYFAGDGGSVLTEYVESGTSTSPHWVKAYVYLGGRMLASLQSTGGSTEAVSFHHPDRLGTRLVTSPHDGSYSEQEGLPYGTVLDAGAMTTRRFTSYERSNATGLDYAVNRQYDPLQGRFTQVDPIEMGAVDLSAPQTLNLYAYCTNDPINLVDPDGLFSLGGIFRAIGRVFAKVFKWAAAAAGVLVAFVAVATGHPAFYLISALLFGLAFGPPALQRIIGAVGSSLATYQKAIGGLGGMGPGGTAVFNPHAGTGLGEASVVSRYVFNLQEGDEILTVTTSCPRSGTTPLCPGQGVPWHERGIFKPLGEFATGVADEVTFGFTRWFETRMGRRKNLDENSAAYRLGGNSGMVAGVILPGPGKLRAAKMITVSRWGRPGLEAGDWVMKGGKTRWNYIRSFKWQPGVGNQFADFASGQTFLVPASHVKWPRGWGIDGRWKGLFGQRRYFPPNK